MKRIGIYAGTFNPVHAGHISFALQSLQVAGLDAVYFLPERRPRSKQNVEHFGHRVAMLRKAVRPHRQLKVLELEDVSFTVKTSLPRLQYRFTGAQLVFLLGSDAALTVPQWDNAAYLLQTSELVIGARGMTTLDSLRQALSKWPTQPKNSFVFASQAPEVSSRLVRQAIQQRQYTTGLLRSVKRYSDRHWLYVSLA